MRRAFPTIESNYHLNCLLDDMAGCDPAFDAVYDELEWEFACRRLHSSNE